MRTSSSESSNGGASTVQPRGIHRNAEDELAGSTLRPMSKASGRSLEGGPTLLTQQRPEPMEDEMPIQLSTQVTFLEAFFVCCPLLRPPPVDQ